MEFVVRKVVYINVSRSGYTFVIVKAIEHGKIDDGCMLLGEITEKNLNAHDHLVVREPKREYNPKYSQYEYKTNFLMKIRYPPEPKHALLKMTKSMGIKPILAKQLIKEYPGGDPWKCIQENKKPATMDDHDWLNGILSKVDAFKGTVAFDEKDKRLTDVVKWFETNGLNWGENIVKSIIYSIPPPTTSEQIINSITTNPMQLRHVMGIGLAKLKQFVSILNITDEKKREYEAIFCIYERQAMQGHIYFKHKEIPGIKDPTSFPNVIHVNEETGRICLVEQREKEKTIVNILEEFNAELVSDDDNNDLDIPPELSFEQAKAYTNAFEHHISCITGVPGGGKSYVIGTICRKWLEDYEDCNIVLLAPTGRAVYRLKEMREHFRVCERNTHCMTIHKFVYSGIKCIQEARGNLEYDIQTNNMFVVIDECSMVDTPTFNMALKCMKQYQVDKLLLVGDTNQLPPVGYGDVFRNLLESKTFETVHLNTVYRQASGESALKKAILAVKDKCVPQVVLDDPSYERIICDRSNIEEELLKMVQRYDHTAFERQDVIVLASTNKTVDAYQMKLANNINPNRHRFITKNENETPNFVKGDVVRHRGNVYESSENSNEQHTTTTTTVLLNGTPGVIVEYDETEHTFVVNYNDRQRCQYTNKNVFNVELGYIGTVHKSQGSEANVVIFVLESYKCLVHNWSLLYTAITRAKDKCIIIGPNDVFVNLVTTLATKRRTTLHEHFT